MERGYVKLWRKSLDSGLLQNHKLWAFWCWCLMKATHKPIKHMVGHQLVQLDSGQFIFGRKAAARETGLTERNIRTYCVTLQNIGNLTIKSTNKFSIVSIINWGCYQQTETPNDQQNDQHVTSKRPASDHKQEHKNIRSNIYSRVVVYLNKKTNSNFKPDTKKTVSLIAARSKEGFTADDFKTVIDYCCHKWMNDIKFQVCLRPETLFSNKFESYLNDARRINGSQSGRIEHETQEDLQREIAEHLL